MPPRIRERNTMHDLVVVGAGAAGLGAARTAIDLGLQTVVVEAAHRIGGRAYSEEIKPGVPFDLGCHWLHSGSLNPFAAVADRLGVSYVPRSQWNPRLRVEGGWANDHEREGFFRYWDQMDARIETFDGAKEDTSVAELIDRDSPWSEFYDYWTSLMTSSDSDLVSVADMAAYRDTHENWPVTDGYGNLVARFGTDIPVELNSAVEKIERTRAAVKVHTARGIVESKIALVTVSNGVLASEHIRFDPPLPDWKREAISGVRLGNHNRIAVALDGDPLGDEAPVNIIDMGDEVPMLLHVKPYGHPYIVGATGGRFADWLERAGVEASVDHLVSRLKRIFGSSIENAVGRHIVTAWGGDPWTMGAYSACLPGQAHQRDALAAPIDGQLWFAGEATSPDFFSTCHGAYLSGIKAAHDVASALGSGAKRTAP